MDGILIVDKPAGWTSSDVVGFVRGRGKVKRVGHTGTLDPAATGVLPICLGQATRVAEYLTDADKTYVADIVLGVETDTYDADGEVLSRADATHITSSQIEAVLLHFEGEFDQVPPMYSAIKRQGVPMYKLARAGVTINLPARRVRVDHLRVLSYEASLLRVEIDCAKGFYVRSLAHDIGAALGVGGSLSGLVRSRVGAFGLGAAVDIETLRREFEAGTWQGRLWPADEVLVHWQAIILGPATQRLLCTGQHITVAEERQVDSRGLCRVYSSDGDFVAVARREPDGAWSPEKVFQPVT